MATLKNNKSLKQAIMFIIFSLGAGVVEFGTFTLLGLFSDDSGWLAIREVISVILSCLFNFTLNRKYTFKSSNNLAVGMLLYGLFYLITTPLWAMGLKSVIDIVGIEYDTIAKLVKMLINFVMDFLYCKFIVFGLANRWNTKKKS